MYIQFYPAFNDLLKYYEMNYSPTYYNREDNLKASDQPEHFSY